MKKLTTSSSNGAGDVRYVNKEGSRDWNNSNKRKSVVRPDSF